MKSPLEALHIELVECIVTYLEPCDIFSLRQTSHTLEEKASQGSFTALFKRKNIDLTTSSLQELVRITSQGRLGCYLEHCAILGIARNATMPAVESTDEHLRLLTEAFRNLKQRSPKGCLTSVCFRVAKPIEEEDEEPTEEDDEELNGEEDEGLSEEADEVVTEPSAPPSWRDVWNAALRTFNLTMAALNESKLPVSEHLDIFGSLRGCSLTRDDFLSFAQEFPSVAIFRFLKKLTVSLSLASTRTEQEYSDDESWTPVDKQALLRDSHVNPHDILQVLRRIMPELESLELHWYNVERSISYAQLESATPQESKPSSTRIMGLKECSLHGIYLSESDLLNFLEAVHPVRVTLTNIHLTSGTYASIFNYLTGPDSPVTYYHLDDLREGRRLVYYDGVPGKPKFPYKDNLLGPSTLTRDDVTEAIRYRFPTARSLGSGQRMRWTKSKEEEFGPPNDVQHSFAQLNWPIIRCPDGSDDDGPWFP